MKNQNKTGLKYRSPIVGLSIVALLIAGGLGAFYLLRQNNRTATDSVSEKIDLNPPTKAEIDETDRHKETIIQKNSEPANNPGNPKAQTVTPIIGFLQQSQTGSVESNGYIAGISETGGTCTLTLIKDGVKVEESRQALADAQGTVCGYMEISKNRLSRGDWKATIIYSSEKHFGTSAEGRIQVN